MLDFRQKAHQPSYMKAPFNPSTDAAELQVKTSFGAQPYTTEEIAILTAKGWYEFSGSNAYGNYKKIVKQDGKYVLFIWMDDGDGGWWDEWSDAVYSNINDVPKIDGMWP